MANLAKAHLRKNDSKTFCGRIIYKVNLAAKVTDVDCRFCRRRHDEILEEDGVVEYYKGEAVAKRDEFKRACNRDDCRRMFEPANKFNRTCGNCASGEKFFDWNGR